MKISNKPILSDIITDVQHIFDERNNRLINIRAKDLLIKTNQFAVDHLSGYSMQMVQKSLQRIVTHLSARENIPYRRSLKLKYLKTRCLDNLHLASRESVPTNQALINRSQAFVV